MFKLINLLKKAVALLVMSIPISDSLKIETGGSVVQLLGLNVAFLVLIIFFSYTKKVRSINIFHVLTSIFLIWMSLTYFWSLRQDESIVSLLSFLQLLIFSIIIYNIIEKEEDLILLAKSYVLGALVASWLLLREFILGIGFNNGERYAAAGYDPNDFALYLILGIFLCIYLYTTRSNWPRWLSYLLISLFSFSIVLTGSRSIFLSLIVSLFTLIIIEIRKGISRILTIILVFFILGSTILLFVPQSSINRLAGITNEIEHGTLTGRRIIWDSGLEALKKYYLFGSGTGTFREASSSIGGIDAPSHNTYLSIAVEGGVIGFILFLASFIIVFYILFKVDYNYRIIFSFLLISYMIGIFALTWEYRKPLWFVLTYATCISAFYSNRNIVKIARL